MHWPRSVRSRDSRRENKTTKHLIKPIDIFVFMQIILSAICYHYNKNLCKMGYGLKTFFSDRLILSSMSQNKLSGHWHIKSNKITTVMVLSILFSFCDIFRFMGLFYICIMMLYSHCNKQLTRFCCGSLAIIKNILADLWAETIYWLCLDTTDFARPW